MRRAYRLSLEAEDGYSIQIVDARHVLLKSPRGSRYRVDLTRGVCDCAGSTFHGHCKHVDMALRLVALLGEGVPEAVGLMKVA